MQLLVSVRSRAEALAALDGGADIIDAKDPAGGALGRVSQLTFASIVDAVASRLPVTAAAGDAEDEAAVEAQVFALARAGAVFVKVGFAGVDRAARVASLVAAATKGATAARASLVAVAYADYDDVNGLPPDAMVATAARSGARGVLLDTAVKDGRGLLQRMSEAALDAWIGRVQAAGMFAAVAGQLVPADLDLVRRCGADIAGVRGAACEGGRDGVVSVPRVRALEARLRGSTRRRQSIEVLTAAPAQSTDRR